MSSLRFRTRLTLIAGSCVLLGLIASVYTAIRGVNRLSQESSSVVRQGLEEASREYLGTYIEESARQANLLMERTASELRIAAAAAQTFADHETSLDFINGPIGDLPLFADKLKLDAQRLWQQNEPPEPCVVPVLPYMLDGQKRPLLAVRVQLRRSALLEPTLAALQRHGINKLQTYFVGSLEAPALRLCPWVNVAEIFSKLYPEGMSKNFWTYFFPGLVESWQQWLKSPELLRTLPTQVTVTAPYLDAGGGGLVVTLFHPLWSPDRRSFAGAIGLDITLKQLHAFVEHVHIAQSGFAFLLQENSNVLAVKPQNEKTLGILGKSSGNSGVDLLDRKLSASSEAALAALRLPSDDQTHYHEVLIGSTPYVIVLRRLAALQMWSGKVGLSPEAWTLGFLVPKHEVYATLLASQQTIKARTKAIVASQLSIALLTLVLLLVALVLIARRLTHDLVALTGAASRVMKKDYDVQVSPRSDDEIGQLGRAFNTMVSEIRAYTTELEHRVALRTNELKLANEEITLLNRRLQAENMRMGAELDVARRVQTMVLPPAQQQSALDALDIVGHMQPATEVGGDYYDVLRTPTGLRIGIGDVTGHGLKSGVLMLMIQAAIRTVLDAGEQDLKRSLAIVNKAIFNNVTRIGSGLSATLSLLEYSQGQLRITGQHEDILVVRSDGKLEVCSTQNLGLPIGLEQDIEPMLELDQIALQPGDVVLLYTDGVIEAENPSQEQFGSERLCRSLQAHHQESAQQIKDAILADVHRFINGHEVYDDITLVVLKRR